MKKYFYFISHSCFFNKQNDDKHCLLPKKTLKCMKDTKVKGKKRP